MTSGTYRLRMHRDLPWHTPMHDGRTLRAKEHSLWLIHL